MPLAAWRENSSRHVASLRRIRLVFFIAPVSSTITGRDYPQWTDLRKYVAELPVTGVRLYDLESGRLLTTLGGFVTPRNSLFTPDGKTLLISDSTLGEVRIFDAHTWARQGAI